MIYLDNAATTPMLPEVVEVMRESMMENFGNPSSTHHFGRKAKAALELARKSIAKQFNVSSSEIIFTSSGTEADNLVLINAVVTLGVKRIVTSRIEHHAVLNTVKYLESTHDLLVNYVNVNEFGEVDLIHLETLLSQAKEKTLVSLMMVNNEIGNVLPIAKVCDLCHKYGVLFHSDTVQAVGQLNIDLQKTPIDFIVASAHKFHGPKGVGFAYIRKGLSIAPMIYGGNQEKGVRSSTENIPAILGMAKALEISRNNIDKDNAYKNELKLYLIQELLKVNNEIQFNGCSFDVKKSVSKILNVRFPFRDKMLLFNLDLAGFAVSGGSACQSGANKVSYVLKEFLDESEILKASVRFSFSKFNTKSDIDQVVLWIKKRFF